MLLFYPETMWTVREWPSFREEQGRAPRRDGFIQTKVGPEEGAGGRMEAGGLMEEQETLQENPEE